MGVKLRIIESAWSKAIQEIYKIDIVGMILSGTPYQYKNEYSRGDYYVVVFPDIGTFYVKIGAQAVIYKEEIFSDKEYEELWI